jgi:peptide deformylase
MYYVKDHRIRIYSPLVHNVVSKYIEESEYKYLPGLLEYMVEVMDKHRLAGLSAPQIGLFIDFIAINRDGQKAIGLANPEILRLYGKEVYRNESSPGLPPEGNECKVPRMQYVDIEASLADEPYIRRRFSFKGRWARVVQHQLDYLTGTFFTDRASILQGKMVLENFSRWKAMRRAQIRMEEVKRNVEPKFVSANSGQLNLS